MRVRWDPGNQSMARDSATRAVTSGLTAFPGSFVLSKEMAYSSLKVWAMQVAKRRGLKRAKVACARKLATILHRMWIEETDFRWGKETSAAA